jgi:hypothetical protein
VAAVAQPGSHGRAARREIRAARAHRRRRACGGVRGARPRHRRRGRGQAAARAPGPGPEHPRAVPAGALHRAIPRAPRHRARLRSALAPGPAVHQHGAVARADPAPAPAPGRTAPPAGSAPDRPGHLLRAPGRPPRRRDPSRPQAAERLPHPGRNGEGPRLRRRAPGRSVPAHRAERPGGDPRLHRAGGAGGRSWRCPRRPVRAWGHLVRDAQRPALVGLRRAADRGPRRRGAAARAGARPGAALPRCRTVTACAGWDRRAASASGGAAALGRRLRRPGARRRPAPRSPAAHRSRPGASGDASAAPLEVAAARRGPGGAGERRKPQDGGGGCCALRGAGPSGDGAADRAPPSLGRVARPLRRIAARRPLRPFHRRALRAAGRERALGGPGARRRVCAVLGVAPAGQPGAALRSARAGVEPASPRGRRDPPRPGAAVAPPRTLGLAREAETAALQARAAGDDESLAQHLLELAASLDDALALEGA